MEEWVGNLWHRIVTKAAVRRYPDAAVRLVDIDRTLSVFFHALGGEAGIKLVAAPAVRHGGQRHWLQRLAGSGQKVELSWCDDEGLRLPATIDIFPEKTLNYDLYLWLTALSAVCANTQKPWIERNQDATLSLLTRFPGLKPRYHLLVHAYLATRLPPESLHADEATQEHAIRKALMRPGSVSMLPDASTPFQPVLLWPHPSPPDHQTSSKTPIMPNQNLHESHHITQSSNQKFLAERTEMPDGKDGFLMMFRAESIFSWSEFIRVNRPQDTEDADDILRTAEDLDSLTIARDAEAGKASVRFDLDLPPTNEDDEIIISGIALPEWDYRQQVMREAHCHLQEMRPGVDIPHEIPAALRPIASKLRRQFRSITSLRTRLRAQEDGDDIDMDQWLQMEADRVSGTPSVTHGLYRQQHNRHRDMACLLLADLSLSTDTYVSDNARIIDVIRDSLYLFSETLMSIGDRFALCGFSSLKRGNIRFHRLKDFDEPFTSITRGRIAQIRPGYYTRMGAAIRHATTLINRRDNQQKLLLLLTDGKPNDLDQYEGRYGIEDTRSALHEARRMGVKPFCVTIDKEAHDYLPHLFGKDSYIVIRKPEELPMKLIKLYGQLTNR